MLGFFGKIIPIVLLSSHQKSARSGRQAGDACGDLQIAFFMLPLTNGYRSKNCFFSSNTHSAKCKTKTAVKNEPPPLSIWITIWQFSVTTLFCPFSVHIVFFLPLTLKPHPTQQDGICITKFCPPSPGVPGWLERQDTTVMDEDLIAFLKYVGI